jgi:hypothetical protein
LEESGRTEMIFYSIYNLTLERYIRIDGTKNIRLISKIWLPKIVLLKRFKSLVNDISKLYNQKEIKEVEDSQVMRLLFQNKLNLLQAMYLCLFLTTNEQVLKDFKERYGVEFTGLDGLAMIKSEMDVCVSKINAIDERNRRKADQTPVESNFSEIVESVESAIGRPIDHRISVYEFKAYFDRALKTSREYRREKEKLKVKK